MRSKIEKHNSLLHADRILREVRKLWPTDEGWAGTIECWSNGREQGYHLSLTVLDDERFGQAACVFSEGRSCDGALVMVGNGESDDFNYQTHQPSEEVWMDRKYFYDCAMVQDWTEEMKGRGDKKAAKYIIARFREELAKSVEKNRKAKESRNAGQKELAEKMKATGTLTAK